MIGLGSISSGVRLFQQGEAVANPQTWKNSQVAVTAFSAFLIGALDLLKSFGYNIPVTQDDINTLSNLAFYLVAGYNVLVTIITEEKLLFKKKPAQSQPSLDSSTKPPADPEPQPLAEVSPLEQEPSPFAQE